MFSSDLSVLLRSEEHDAVPVSSLASVQVCRAKLGKKVPEMYKRAVQKVGYASFLQNK